MSSSKKSERVRKFGEYLKAPFRRNGSRSPSPGPRPVTPNARPVSSSTPVITTNITKLTKISAGSSSGTDQGIVKSNARIGSTDATRDQLPNPKPLAHSVPAKNEAFQQAIKKYTDNLSDDDRVAFKSAADIMEELGRLSQSKSDTSSFHNTQNKVQKVLQCMKKFLESVAICIQQSPEISSLVVGGLHCILTVSSYLLLIITYINSPYWTACIGLYSVL